MIINNIKIRWIMDFAVTAKNRLKIKEGEKKDKYSDFAREIGRLWDMRVTVIPTTISILGMVPKDSESRLEK